MAIQKDAVITKDDIFEYIGSKGYDQIAHVSVKGEVFQQHSDRKIGYFWNRSDYNYFLTPVWAVGTTYELKDRVYVDDGGNNRVFTSMSGANTGNDPLLAVDETNWHEVIGGTIWSSYSNIQVETSTKGDPSDDDYVEYWIYKVTWDINEDEVKTLVRYYKTTLTGGDTVWTSTIDSGYYYYDLHVSARGGISKSQCWLRAKPGANDMDQEDVIRVFDSSKQELLPIGTSEVTPTLAKSGKLTTVDYFGGDYEVHVP